MLMKRSRAGFFRIFKDYRPVFPPDMNFSSWP